MCAGTSTSFEGTAIHEGRFRVAMSNSGKKAKPNPNPVNYAGLQVRCEQQGCNKNGKYLYRVCGARKHKFLHTTDWVGLLRPDDGVLGQPVKIPVRRGGTNNQCVRTQAFCHIGIFGYLDGTRFL